MHQCNLETEPVNSFQPLNAWHLIAQRLKPKSLLTVELIVYGWWSLFGVKP
jgi:hypothetical protein